MLRQWKIIYYKHKKANKLYSLKLQMKMFKRYVKAIELTQIGSG